LANATGRELRPFFLRVDRKANSLQWLDMKITARMALVAALGFLYGCGNSSNPAMTGTWLFALMPSDSASPSLELTANLTQSGTQITGQVSLTGNAASCGSSASITGSLSGDTITLQLTQAQSTIDFSGTANPAFTSVSGTYTAAAGSCLQNGGIGSWSAALE
jgi:hypothetical protein